MPLGCRTFTVTLMYIEFEVLALPMSDKELSNNYKLIYFNFRVVWGYVGSFA